MNRIAFMLAAFVLPISAQASADFQIPAYSAETEFDLDGDGRNERILILSEGCEDGVCPVVIPVDNQLLSLGYSRTVRTGYMSADDAVVTQNIEGNAADTPVVELDGVYMAYDGQMAFPVGDLISNRTIEQRRPDEAELHWAQGKKGGSLLEPYEVTVYHHDFDHNGTEERMIVYPADSNGLSSWAFVVGEKISPVAEGVAYDYPAVFQHGNTVKFVSTTKTSTDFQEVDLGN